MNKEAKRYTPSHEWVADDGTVGITSYASQELGEVVYVELPQVGREVKAGDEVAVLESTKAAADIYAPISGKISAINTALSEATSLLNRFPESEGWLFKIEPSTHQERNALLDQEAYQLLVQR